MKLYRRFTDKLKYQHLFIKMFSITLVSIVTVSVLTWIVMLRMSEQVFIDTFSITNSKIISQMNNSFEGLSYAISMATSSVAANGEIRRFLSEDNSTSLENLNRYYAATKEMERIQATLTTFQISMLVIGENGNRHETETSVWNPDYQNIFNDPTTIKVKEQPRYLHYFVSKDEERPNEAAIIAAKALRDRSTQQIYGVLFFSIRELDFQKNFGGFASEGNDLLFVHKDGQVLSSNIAVNVGSNEQELVQYAMQIEDEKLDYLNIMWQDRSYMLLSRYIPTYDSYIINLIDKRTVLSQMLNLKTVAMICIAIVFISLCIVFFVSNRITRSLTKLARQMSRVTRRNFGNYITVSGSNEIEEVGKAFNLMLDELNDYITELLKTQREQRNAELSALQMQINPHFLYNTLASIKILVQKGDKDKATSTMNALIELLQNTIGNANEMISVAEELVNLRNYVYINHVRYGEKINVSYFVEEQCYPYELPKLIIQPFIENAFFHAFQNGQEGYIYIMISSQGNNLICEVVDNGVGFDIDKPNIIKSTKPSTHFFSGIGIRNVNDRLELLYGEGYGVLIDSVKGEGTKVKITLPINSPKKNTKIQ